MKSILILSAGLVLACGAHAQNRCVAHNGKVTYQDAPCPDADAAANAARAKSQSDYERKIEADERAARNRAQQAKSASERDARQQEADRQRAEREQEQHALKIKQLADQNERAQQQRNDSSKSSVKTYR